MNEELKVVISAEISDLKQGVSEAQGEIDKLTSGNKAKFDEFSNGFTKIGDACTKGLAVVGTAVAGAATALLALAETTKEYRTAQEKLNSAFEAAGGSAQTASQTYNDLYRVLGDSDVAVEAANHLAQLTTNEQELSEWTEICQGVYATFGDSLPIEGLTEAVNHTAKLGEVQGPLADALEWSGISADSFNEQLAACATEGERAALIQETLAGLYGEAAAAYEENAASLLAANEAQAKLDASMAALGETMEPIMTSLKELAADVLADLAPYLQDFAEKHLPGIKEALSGMGEKIGEVISWIADNWDIISTVGTIVLGIVAAISALSAGLTAYNTVMAITTAVSAPVAGIILAIVAAVAALVAGIVLLVKNWDTVKETAQKVWDKVKEIVSGAVDAIVEFFSNLWNKITETCGKIKDAVTEKFQAIKESMQQKMEEAKAAVEKIYESIKEVMAKAMEAGKQTIQEKLNNIKNAYNEHGGGVKGIVAGYMEAVKGFYTAGYTFIDKLTNGKLSDMVNTIKSKMDSAKQTISNILEAIKNKFNDIWEKAKSIVSNAIEKIKSFFNFKWELPKIKLPHFSITGKFSLNPPQIPKFSVEWYQKGGIFDEPTLFPYGNGKMGGLGENGAEAIVPLEKNTEWLDRIAERLGAGGNRPVVLQVDGKTFAETSISTINELTRQTGSLSLVLV